jgi:hypothetical protein
MLSELNPAEYAAYLQGVGDVDAALALYSTQYMEGFAAFVNRSDFESFRPVAWQDGWSDAEPFGSYAGWAFLRMGAEH